MLYLVLIICLVNLARMSLYIISSDVYSVKLLRQNKRRKRWHLPTISVVIPAHNEEKTIERALQSVYNSNYPASKLEVIVANDGSKDKTKAIARKFKQTHKDGCKIRLINRLNKGKASVLNYVMRRSARGNLIMCLDADSALEPNSLRSAAQHFRNRQTVALSSNVNIIEDGTVLALAQRFEYVVCYQMKKAQAQLGVEYIVGGIGSVFRRSMLKKVSFYDNNTMTEDIDLTMKIIVNKRKNQKIAYAADSVVYTEPAHSLKELLQQRFRWKYGRSQTFVKNSALFFDRRKLHARRLTWVMLPFALLQDLLFLFEPIILGYFLYGALRYGETGTYTSAIIVLSFYMLCNIWASDNLSIKQRLRLSFYAPPMYLSMYLLSIAEYYALAKAIILSPQLKSSIRHSHSWNHPTRQGKALATN